jgi:hypothetical protein
MAIRAAVCAALLALVCITAPAVAAPPLHEQIDAAMKAGYAGPTSARSDDAEFLRRIYLDFTGTIPTVDQARAFLADGAADKRVKLVDQLLASPEFPRRMAEFFTVMLLERRKGADIKLRDWEAFLVKAFEQNEPWDKLAGEILSSDGTDPAARPAVRFFLDRGDNIQLITRDVGRLFLGRDMLCAQCHKHPTIDEYSQLDYQGLFAFFTTGFRHVKGETAYFMEKPVTAPIEFVSVRTGEKGKTFPRVPNGKEVQVPEMAKGEEFAAPPKDGMPGVPKFPVRPLLARDLATAENPAFTVNIANRLWFMMMGRGLIYPLDLIHGANPPSNPKAMELLSHAMGDSKFDMKGLLRELALTEVYQRSGKLPAGAPEPAAATFGTFNAKGLSAEQMARSVLQATGNLKAVLAQPVDAKESAAPNMELVEKKFRDAMASPAGEPEEDFAPSLAGALFLSNDAMILDWLKPHDGNLVERLTKLADPAAVADELSFSIYTRPATAAEKATVADYLKKRGEPNRAAALGELAWSMLASTEFCLNH